MAPGGHERAQRPAGPFPTSLREIEKIRHMSKMNVETSWFDTVSWQSLHEQQVAEQKPGYFDEVKFGKRSRETAGRRTDASLSKGRRGGVQSSGRPLPAAHIRVYLAVSQGQSGVGGHRAGGLRESLFCA